MTVFDPLQHHLVCPFSGRVETCSTCGREEPHRVEELIRNDPLRAGRPMWCGKHEVRLVVVREPEATGPSGPVGAEARR